MDPKPSTEEPLRLFESDFLEFFTHVHPAVVPIIWLPVAVTVISMGLRQRAEIGTWLYFPVCFLAGLIIWTLTEYTLHRFVFHYRAKTPRQRRLTFLFHGNHHAQPMAKTRLVMPPVVSIPLGVTFYSAYYLLCAKVMTKPHWTCPLFAATVTGYICYDMIHYSIHHIKLNSRYLTFVKKHHMRHHFQTWNKRFGVTSPIWDLAFGTWVKP